MIGVHSLLRAKGWVSNGNAIAVLAYLQAVSIFCNEFDASTYSTRYWLMTLVSSFSMEGFLESRSEGSFAYTMSRKITGLLRSLLI